MNFRNHASTFLFSLGLVLIGISGCASNPEPAAARDGQSDSASDRGSAPSESVPIRGRQSGLNAKGMQVYGLKHITSQAQFERLGLANVEPTDFENSDMVLLAAGEQQTGGYWVRITGLTLRGRTLTVRATANRPSQNGATTQALTYPYSIVTTPKLEATELRSDIKSVTGQTKPQSG